MPEPFELLAAPFDVFLAPAATPKPAIDVDPTGAGFDLLGTRGADEYDEAGVTATHEQTVNLYRGLRGTGPIKAFRTSEGLMLGFTLNDLTLESYGKVLNDAAVDDTGNARAVTLHQGAIVETFALLAKAQDGPYGDGLPIQYYIPKVFQSASPAVVHAKGKPAGLILVFTALEDLDATSEEERFGVLEAQDTAS